MRLLIFDFDGTLWDSLELIREVLNELGPRFGFEHLSVAKMDALRRSSARQIIRELGLRPRQVPTLARSVRARVNERRAELRPFEGILDALELLRERGYSLALLSSNHEGAIRSLLGPRWVEAFVHIEGDTGMWDKPAALERILGRLELRAEQAMYLGDELRDIEAARKAGLDAVAVEWGANHAQLLVTASPALMVGAPSELPGALERHDRYVRDYGGRLDAPAAWAECARALRELSGDLGVRARLLPVGLRRALTLTYLLAHSIDSLATHDVRPVERLATLARALEEGAWPVSELSELERACKPRQRRVFALMPKLLRLLEALPSAQCGALTAALLARIHVAQRELRRRHQHSRFAEAAEYAPKHVPDRGGVDPSPRGQPRPRRALRRRARGTCPGAHARARGGRGSARVLHQRAGRKEDTDPQRLFEASPCHARARRGHGLVACAADLRGGDRGRSRGSVCLPRRAASIPLSSAPVLVQTPAPRPPQPRPCVG